jgi:hypothetical protein
MMHCILCLCMQLVALHFKMFECSSHCQTHEESSPDQRKKKKKQIDMNRVPATEPKR